MAWTRYLKQQPTLRQFGANTVAVDEIEAGVALAQLVLIKIGAADERIRRSLLNLTRPRDRERPADQT